MDDIAASCKRWVYVMLDWVCCNRRVLGLGLGYLLRLPAAKVLVFEHWFVPFTSNASDCGAAGE